ncbi:hypothetical protein D3C86_1688150 [compost metagenome]
MEASSRLMPSSSGTILVRRLVSLKLSSSTRPTSLMAALAPRVPKVTIWATLSRPYFWATYSMTSPRRSMQKSISISGMLTRSGLRKRSNSRKYLTGSMLVILRQ